MRVAVERGCRRQQRRETHRFDIDRRLDRGQGAQQGCHRAARRAVAATACVCGCGRVGVVAWRRLAVVVRRLRLILRGVMVVARGMSRGRRADGGWVAFGTHHGRAERAANRQQQRKQHEEDEAKGFHWNRIIRRALGGVVSECFCRRPPGSGLQPDPQAAHPGGKRERGFWLVALAVVDVHGELHILYESTVYGAARGCQGCVGVLPSARLGPGWGAALGLSRREPT